MRDEKEERKKHASKVKQTNKAKQHSTPMYTLVLSYASYNDDSRVEGKARHARQILLRYILLVLEKESSGF